MTGDREKQRLQSVVIDEDSLGSASRDQEQERQIAIFDLLRERHRRGVTVVVVVHDLNLAAAYCDRLLLCRAGQPPLAGSIEEILTYQRVKESFGVDVYVGVNEVTGARFLIPMTPQREK